MCGVGSLLSLLLWAVVLVPSDTSASDRSIRQVRSVPTRAASILLDVRPNASPDHELSIEDIEFNQMMFDQDAALWFAMEPSTTKLSVDERAAHAFLEVLTSDLRQEIKVSVMRAFALAPPLAEIQLQKSEGVTRTAIRWDLADSRNARVPSGLYVITAYSDAGGGAARGLVRVERSP